MPDITMCSGGECPLKETCYCFTATPDEYWQAYFTEVPYKDGKCDYYWDRKTVKCEWEQCGPCTCGKHGLKRLKKTKNLEE